MVQAVTAPVVADGDTGYGNFLNVRRTIQEYERAGVAAIHIEDQGMPKRCGHMEGKQVIDAREWQRKSKLLSIRGAIWIFWSSPELILGRCMGSRRP